MAKKAKKKTEKKVAKKIPAKPMETEQQLSAVNEDATPDESAKPAKEKDEDDDLTPGQLDKALKEADIGEMITLEEFKKMSKRWRSK